MCARAARPRALHLRALAAPPRRCCGQLVKVQSASTESISTTRWDSSLSLARRLCGTSVGVGGFAETRTTPRQSCAHVAGRARAGKRFGVGAGWGKLWATVVDAVLPLLPPSPPPCHAAVKIRQPAGPATAACVRGRELAAGPADPRRRRDAVVSPAGCSGLSAISSGRGRGKLPFRNPDSR